MAEPSGTPIRNRLAEVLGALLAGASAVIAVMLVTDQNLQTNFGATSRFFSHWYGLLALGAATLAVAVLILRAQRSTGATVGRRRLARLSPVLGIGWASLSIVAMVGILATYQQVGFPSAAEFAKYLFGVTPYPGALSYIPWLYDLLLSVYVASVAVGVAAVIWAHRHASSRGVTPLAQT